jgi:hypothetical protein
MNTLHSQLKTPQAIKESVVTTTILEILNTLIISLVLVPKKNMLDLQISSWHFWHNESLNVKILRFDQLLPLTNYNPNLKSTPHLLVIMKI